MAVAKGKNIVLLIRDLSQPTTEADYILYQTDFSKTISKEIDETVTKTGTIKATSDSSTEISVTALAQEDDAVLDTLEDGMHTDNRYGFWEINKAVVSEGSGDAGKYKALYYEGEITNFDMTAGAEGPIEVTMDLTIDGVGQRGFATLTEEQEEFVQYVFKDTVAG